jgi:NTP pyrophosphatase (non-canonical NTP hydrolase)
MNPIFEDTENEEAREFLDQYVESAKRTEPGKQDIIFDPDALALAIGMFIGAGNVLDKIKKYVFYNKPIDDTDLKKDLDYINGFSESFIDLEREGGFFAFNMDAIPVNDRLFHAVMGIATEASELVEAMKDGFPDSSNVLEELGDLNWYEAIAIDEVVEGDFSEVLKTNIRKLRHRYPEKFTSENAIRRDLEGEQFILSALDRD